MALNMRNPLIKRPLMMTAIEGGAIFILTLLAGETIGKVVQLSLIAGGIAGVAGLGIGAFEKATVKPSKFQAPSKREKAKKKQKEETHKEEPSKAATPVGASSTPADASRTKSWAERTLSATEESTRESSVESAGRSHEHALPTVTTSESVPVSAAPKQSLSPSAPTSIGAESPEAPSKSGTEELTPALASAPSVETQLPEIAAASSAASTPDDDEQSQAAALLNQLISNEESAPGTPATVPASTPPAQPHDSSAGRGEGAGLGADVELTAAIIHPEEELRSHIREQLRSAGIKIVVDQDEFQGGLGALLEQQPDLIVTAAPPMAEEYFQNVRRACQFGVIVLYGDEDPGDLDQITGVWRPWTPLNVEALRTTLGLPSQ